MPGLDGVEVLTRAHELDPELPIILMTAHASVPTAIEAMRRGAFDYVEKPFDNTELKTLVRRALDVSRLSRENRYLRAELAQQGSPTISCPKVRRCAMSSPALAARPGVAAQY